MQTHSLEQYTKQNCLQITIDSNTTKDSINSRIFKGRKRSFVWDFFRPIGNGRSFKCIICDSKVSKQTSNLARHLLAAHDINGRLSEEKETRELVSKDKIGRSSQSFVWKYCTKVDNKYSRCHLCDKHLYFGCGNIGNLSKHLQRKHSDIIKTHELTNSKDMDESREFIAIISSNQIDSVISGEEEDRLDEGPQEQQQVAVVKNETQLQQADISQSAQISKERRSGSYVWNYCVKLSRNEIRCKLCRKIMSFHGTANVITHLQRRHNIIGGVAHDNTATFEVNEEKMAEINMKDEHYSTSFQQRNRRSPANKSVVWTYYTRLSQDVVRCNLCQKNLSFQGTSNCQRHLHRMHGIVAQGRASGGALKREMIENDSLIQEYCERIEDNKIQCTMCSSTFDHKQTDKIRDHLRVTHSILQKSKAPAKRRKRRRRYREETSDDTDEGDFNNEDEDFQGEENAQYNTDFSGTDIKKDVPTFEDIIEEDNAEETYCDEDPFDPTRLHDYPETKLLSATSSRDGSPEPTTKMSINTSRLRLLNEERMRMETQYFREKAGYYRMQKYHSALQAKKAKIELQRLQSSGLNGTGYNANIDISDAHTSTATLFENHKE